jgi:hypothetical protein
MPMERENLPRQVAHLLAALLIEHQHRRATDDYRPVADMVLDALSCA